MTITSLVSALVLFIGFHPRILSFLNILQACQLLADIKVTSRRGDKSILCTEPVRIGNQTPKALDTGVQKLEEFVHKAPGTSEYYPVVFYVIDSLNDRPDDAVDYIGNLHPNR